MKREWALVGLLSLTATASYLCRVNVSVAGAGMRSELGLTQTQMGAVFSAFLFGYALCQIPGGMLADRWGARRVLAAASLGWAAITAALAGLGAFYAAVLVLRLLLGVLEAPMFPSAARAIAAWLPPGQRGRANGMVIAAIGLGSAIAPPLITAVMLRGGWRTALLVSALPALLAGAAWLKVRVPGQAAPEAAAPAPAGLPRSRSFLLLTLSYTLQGYTGYIFVFWFYLYLVEVRHFDLLRSAALSSMPWILSIVSIPAGGWLFDRMSHWRRAVPVLGMAGAGLFTAIGAATASPYAAAISLALATALILSVEGAFWATMTALAGPRSGTAGGLMNMGSNLGGLISPALTPWLAARFGWERALHVSAALAVLGALLWFWIRETPGPAAAAETGPPTPLPPVPEQQQRRRPGGDAAP
ncbi:MAG: MFS transporter [Bryobacteraceae bacterium]|nr:MFS transporter [Bryobacteraceae bacterium]